MTAESVSKHYDARQLAAIDKIGNLLLPGVADMPKFSAVAPTRHIDRVLDYMPESDRKDLGMLLKILGYCPKFLVAFFLGVLEACAGFPGPLGSGIRFVRLGLRGLVMTLYYCDPAVLKIIGYDVKVHTADFKPYVSPMSLAGQPGTALPNPQP